MALKEPDSLMYFVERYPHLAAAEIERLQDELRVIAGSTFDYKIRKRAVDGLHRSLNAVARLGNARRAGTIEQRQQLSR